MMISRRFVGKCSRNNLCFLYTLGVRRKSRGGQSIVVREVGASRHNPDCQSGCLGAISSGMVTEKPSSRMEARFSAERTRS